MARRRLVDIQAQRVELSPQTDAIVTEREVVFLRGRAEAFVLSVREAQVLASVVGPSVRVDLGKQGSG